MIRRFAKSTVHRGIFAIPRRANIGRIAGCAPRTTHSRAFTLLELVVVVAVMGIILMMGIPAIRSATHRDPMAQAVVDILDACQGSREHPGARSLAILRGRKMELRIFPQERRIEVGEASSGANPGATQDNSAEAPADAPPKPADSAGFSAQLSDRISFKMLDVNFIDCRNEEEATIWFYPDGTSDEFNVILVSDTGEARRITLDIVTALPQVVNLQ
jgi:prepilin-type N-terminal cleavage/methylation domain-containing protein